MVSPLSEMARSRLHSTFCGGVKWASQRLNGSHRTLNGLGVFSQESQKDGRDSTHTEGKSRNVSETWIEIRSYLCYVDGYLPLSTARRYFILRRSSGVGRFVTPMVAITS